MDIWVQMQNNTRVWLSGMSLQQQNVKPSKCPREGLCSKKKKKVLIYKLRQKSKLYC